MVGSKRVDWATRPDTTKKVHKPDGSKNIQSGIEYTVELSGNGAFKIPMQHPRIYNDADAFCGSFVTEYKEGSGSWNAAAHGVGQSGHWKFLLAGGPDRMPAC